MNTETSPADEPTPAPSSMKALRAHRRGGPEQLVYEDAPTPVPADDEVCVRVSVAAITFDELTWPATWEREGVDRTPVVPAHEFAGTVAQVGSRVTGLGVGDAVVGLVPFDRDGAAAELVVVPASSVARKPASVSDAAAAAAVLPALTAQEALTEHLHLTAGDSLLVLGATGGVGSFVTQLAVRAGVDVVAAVRSDGDVARAQQLGATTVVRADEGTPSLERPVDAAVNAAGAETPAWLYTAVRPGGRLVTLQAPADSRLAADAGVETDFFVVDAQHPDVQGLVSLLAGGALDVAVAQTFPLSEGARAYASRGQGARPGKTLLLVAPADA